MYPNLRVFLTVIDRSGLRSHRGWEIRKAFCLVW
jgi:hypothetical protein